MKKSTTEFKDRAVRSIAGLLIILLLVVQITFVIDMSFLICCIGINLFQYGITGWCPFASYFTKIGWMQNH